MVAQFKDLSKKVNDLFKKKYDYKNQVKIVSKAEGVKLETAGTQGKTLTGYTKANWTDATTKGDIEVEAHSTGVAKLQFKLNDVADGVSVTVNTAATSDLSVEAVYAKDSVASQFKVSHNLNKGSTKINASAAIGFEGITVGGSVALDAANPSAPTDYNVGASYAQKDLVAALVTANQGADITASYFQKASDKLVCGAALTVKPESGARLFTFGTDYSLDSNTGIKAKVDSNGIVGTAITRKLADPSLEFALSAQFDSQSADIFAAQKMGVAFTF